MSEIIKDGIHAMLPREKMTEAARRLRDTYKITPDAPIVMREFGYYCLDKWKSQGKISDWNALCHELGIDERGWFELSNMGWCEAEFYPRFEEKVLEARGEDEELVQDFAGRKLLCFKGRRSGFMPTYVDHPVKDMKSWEENCLWRMDKNTPERIARTEAIAKEAVKAAGRGEMLQLHIGGAYMYLRSLIGPEDLLYMFYDDPEVIHACLAQWVDLNDATCAIYQKYVSVDEVFFGEDICYKNGLLISPAMWHEFLKPYYEELLNRIRRRNIDKSRHIYLQIDTDGDCRPAIPLYKELGMDAMSPFEVAAGCDVVEIGKGNPDLAMFGGIDKRVLAEGKEAIDRMLDRIMPAMRKRGGYIPTCDHGVPEEVKFEDWVYYRKRLLEYSK